MWRLVVSKMEHREQLEELSPLWAWGSKLCLAIIGPPWVRNCLLEGMQAAALRRTEVVRDLAMLQAVVSSSVELVLGRTPDETFRVEVMDELVQIPEARGAVPRLDRLGTRFCILLLGPPLG
jgi:hypothetical protein